MTPFRFRTIQHLSSIPICLTVVIARNYCPRHWCWLDSKSDPTRFRFHPFKRLFIPDEALEGHLLRRHHIILQGERRLESAFVDDSCRLLQSAISFFFSLELVVHSSPMQPQLSITTSGPAQTAGQLRVGQIRPIVDAVGDVDAGENGAVTREIDAGNAAKVAAQLIIIQIGVDGSERQNQHWRP